MLTLALLVAPFASASSVRGRILAIARQELGYHEPGNYCTIFGPCEEWCSLFVTWVWHDAGVSIPRLAFTGYLYDWAKAATSVRGPAALPQPGDAVLFGTSPASVATSLHVGIVEAAYPGYLVTIEGDSLHGVRRYVVPMRNPQRIGEPGPIYAYASPVSPISAQRHGAQTRALAALARRHSAGNVVERSAHVSSVGRLLRTIAALRAFQHMPYHIGQARINWTGVNSRGLVEVRVESVLPVSYARHQWQRFLHKFSDTGRAYSVTFGAPPDPPADSVAPSISGTAGQGRMLTESHGVWSNNPTTYSYQWEDCDSWGNNCAPIAGATSQTYAPTFRDIGYSIRVQEIAGNSGGAGGPATSAPTGAIVAVSLPPA